MSKAHLEEQTPEREMRRRLGCIEEEKTLICRYKEGTFLLAPRGGRWEKWLQVWISTALAQALLQHIIICDEAACAWQFPTGCFLTLVRVPARESIIVTSSTTRLKASLYFRSKSLSSLISSSDSFSSWVGLAGELAASGEAGCTQALRQGRFQGQHLLRENIKEPAHQLWREELR